MKLFRADLHIHTVLSACADLEMSPGAVVKMAKDKNIDLTGCPWAKSTMYWSCSRQVSQISGWSINTKHRMDNTGLIPKQFVKLLVTFRTAIWKSENFSKK